MAAADTQPVKVFVFYLFAPARAVKFADAKQPSREKAGSAAAEPAFYLRR
jgi:hypothetical protein